MTIRFFCEGCGKEMWKEADWDHMKYLTLEQLQRQLLCSDCLLVEVKQHEENKSGVWDEKQPGIRSMETACNIDK